ncbi:hypothetical protein GEMMAAP_13130 [Gemmatimonas phototrophica]|uniref:Uncharacterized protein n=1 Tax=Gemmatimonas phototrophica TaxID=1379270 RepID=A0A143BM25_9BACT|nr:hypothetical protein GEMMAAP_13130 [Gemmatimonas phototrophica]
MTSAVKTMSPGTTVRTLATKMPTIDHAPRIRATSTTAAAYHSVERDRSSGRVAARRPTANCMAASRNAVVTAMNWAMYGGFAGNSAPNTVARSSTMNSMTIPTASHPSMAVRNRSA